MFHKHYMKNIILLFCPKTLNPKGSKILHLTALHINTSAQFQFNSKLRTVNLIQVKLAFMGHPKLVILSALIRSKVKLFRTGVNNHSVDLRDVSVLGYAHIRKVSKHTLTRWKRQKKS